MRLVLNILFILFISSTGFTQYSGYLGKKNYASVNLRFYNPTFYMLGAGSTLVQDKTSDTYSADRFRDKLNSAFSLTFGHAFKNNFAMSLEMGIQRGSIAGEKTSYTQKVYQNGYYYDEIKRLVYTPFKVSSFQFMPTFEFSGDGGLAPVGIVNKFGFGIIRTKVVADDDYAAFSESTSSYGDFTKIASGAEVINTDQVYKSGLVFYELGMRLPVSTHLAYYFGVRYQLAFMRGLPDEDPTNSYAYSARTFNESVGSYIRRNYVQANLGINYIF